MTGSHRAAPSRSAPNRPHRAVPARTTPRATRRAARLAAFLGVPAALIASGVFISNASYAAFSATTQNPTSNWTTGNVFLSDDDANTALFTATALKPGSTDKKCITVTSTGSLPASVKLFATGATALNNLNAAMTITIEQAAGSIASCAAFVADPTVGTAGVLYTGTLNAFATASTGFGSGVGSWSPTGVASESRTYRITYLLPTGAPSNAQGLTTQLGLTWESQNT